MMDSEFAAYIEGLPAQDRRTVEQALVGLRSAMNRIPRAERVLQGSDRITHLPKAVRDIARRDPGTRAWLGAGMTKH
jgi:hypothetical protein